jgi:acetyl-CoA C-acetyltransferase
VAVDRRAPCVIGVAQRTWKLSGDEQAPEPLAMWAEVGRAAAEDAAANGGGAAVLAAVDRVDVTYCVSWAYDDPAARAAEALGVQPRQLGYTGMSGTSPLGVLQHVATEMLAGDLDVTVLLSAEAFDTKRRLKKAGERPAWSHREPERSPVVMDPPILPTEISHEVFQAWLTFATYEVAWRARAGLTPTEHRAAVGELFAPFTDVAAANPDAWFPIARTAEALAEATPENRMVGFPYTKHLVSVMDVDMAAAVVVATHEAADRLGVPPEQRAYLRGISLAKDPDHLPEHPEMWRSPAMEHVFGEALGKAGIEAGELGHLDLYSCFPSSVRFALDALGSHGFEADSVQPPTVTGGLPYFGGPGSGYVTHSLGQLVRVLREDPGSYGLASGVGMHMTNHAAAVLSTTPGDGASAPARSKLTPKPATAPMVDEGRGPATLVAYSVVHARSGEPEWALGVLELPDGTRCFGRATDADLLGALEAEEWVGRGVNLTEGPGGANLFVP